MKNKKVTIIIIIMVLIAIVILGTMGILKKQEEKQATQTLYQYISLLNNKDYEGMYEKVASMNRSKEDFIQRNKNIYEGIEASDIQIQIQTIEQQEKSYQITYHQTMYTSAGTVQFDNVAQIEKEKQEYKLKWSSQFIFPQLQDNQKVRISTIKARRGDILDRNNEKLATDGTILSVGVVPKKLEENKEENIREIANLTGVSEEYIHTQLEAEYVKEDTFVPIKKISQDKVSLKEALLQIPGVMISTEEGRAYPMGKQTAHLTGYVQTISSEELAANSEKGYHNKSIIGKAGLEKAYEDILKGTDGAEIYIADEEGNLIEHIIKQDKKDGQNVQLTIDSQMQAKLYEQMQQDKGFFVVMQPFTGELLALVSTPTFDANDFVVGMTTKQWEELNNDTAKPLYNRWLQKYCPGSTFKPITGAIGLTTGEIDENEDYQYSETSWQKDSSWGNYKITTLTGYNKPKNLANALMYSDNIYFAKAALKIGADTLAQNLNKLGFNETIEFPMQLSQSQYASKNGNKIEGETKLADSGYGQGSVLVNPIHMASIYSAFANGGNMIKPYIQYNESRAKNKQGEVLKQGVFSKEAASTIQKDLIQVVENKEGTAHDMKIEGLTIAGKTGTAELKTSSEDTQSGTLGWFDCFTVEKRDGNDVLIISMVENTQGNTQGGSHYLIQKIRKVL